MSKRVNKFPNKTKTEKTFKSTKTSSCFNVKDNIDFEYNHDLIYHTYEMSWTNLHWLLCGSACRIKKRHTSHHSGRDHTSHVLKYSIEKSHKNVNTIDFKIVDKNFRNNKRKRKIAEALWINNLRPTLNTQEKSIQLFNSLLHKIITMDILNNIHIRVTVIVIHIIIDKCQLLHELIP